MIFEIDTEGNTKFLYSDEYAELIKEGEASISRASHVEPAPGGWKVYFPEGKILGPYPLREEALKAEVEYLENKMKEG